MDTFSGRYACVYHYRRNPPVGANQLLQVFDDSVKTWTMIKPRVKVNTNRHMYHKFTWKPTKHKHSVLLQHLS